MQKRNSIEQGRWKPLQQAITQAFWTRSKGNLLGLWILMGYMGWREAKRRDLLLTCSWHDICRLSILLPLKRELKLPSTPARASDQLSWRETLVNLLNPSRTLLENTDQIWFKLLLLVSPALLLPKSQPKFKSQRRFAERRTRLVGFWIKHLMKMDVQVCLLVFIYYWIILLYD